MAKASGFATSIKAQVLSTFPDWAALASAETYKDSPAYWVFAVPPPSAGQVDSPLRISTWDDEITVAFDHHHAHFDRWIPAPDDDIHRSALLFVQALFSEQIGVASWWQGDHCKMASSYIPGDGLAPHFKIAYSRVRVRSWNGTLNIDRAF